MIAGTKCWRQRKGWCHKADLERHGDHRLDKGWMDVNMRCLPASADVVLQVLHGGCPCPAEVQQSNRQS